MLPSRAAPTTTSERLVRRQWREARQQHRDYSWFATIAGGNVNDIGTNSDYSAIGGGYDNNIADNSPRATIAGGLTSTTSQPVRGLATMAGGYYNNVGMNSNYSAIGGGSSNKSRRTIQCMPRFPADSPIAPPTMPSPLVAAPRPTTPAASSGETPLMQTWLPGHLIIPCSRHRRRRDCSPMHLTTESICKRAIPPGVRTVTGTRRRTSNPWTLKR